MIGYEALVLPMAAALLWLGCAVASLTLLIDDAERRAAAGYEASIDPLILGVIMLTGPFGLAVAFTLWRWPAWRD